MQVQSIQTTNDCRKPCFKAHFVPDSKEIFNNLWANAKIDSLLEIEVWKLAKNKHRHELELIAFTDGFYKVLNHFNGKVQAYKAEKYSAIPKYDLYSVVKQINEDKEFFEDYEHGKSDIFRVLTGRKKKVNISDNG